jgi:hypothetical protein
MKKITVIVVVLMLNLIPILLNAQGTGSSDKDIKKVIIVKNTTNSSDLKDLNNIKVEITKDLNMNEEADAPNAPFFGIYPAELDFPKAQELNYPNSYGVLITGVVPNSPAYQYRLVEDDIIMEIGGKKAMNLKEFDKLKAAYRAGDAVKLTIFRAGEIKTIDFVFGSKEPKEVTVEGEDNEKPTKAKLSVGDGGGTWIPMWYQADMDDVNDLVQSLGFDALPDNGLLTQGLGGKGNIGKGWFLGGQGGWYSDSKKTAEFDIASNPTGYTNYMKYKMSFGGATLDKRFAIAKGVTTSFGFMLGGASQTVEVLHSNSQYNWPTTGDLLDGNTYAKISRSYLLVQPRAELMIHFLSWLGIRGEVGYMYGYAPRKGWKVRHMESDDYELKGSPDTPFQGMTVSIGPWFGF